MKLVEGLAELIQVLAQVFDLQGTFSQPALLQTDEGATIRRGQFPATLDGNNVPQDFGSSIGDREFAFSFQVKSQADENRARYLAETYSRLNLAFRSNYYTVQPVNFRKQRDIATFRLRIISQVV